MSEMRLQDGTGKGYTAKVDPRNRISAMSTSQAVSTQRSLDGAGYNLNTGKIGLTSGAESAVFYMKYNGTTKFHVTRIVIGLGVLGGTISDSVEMFVKVNPTLGTIITDETDIDMNANRDLSSANTLAADVYKGAELKTITNGDDAFLFFAEGNQRSITAVDLIMSPGNSMGITVQLNATGGGNIYIAVVGHETEAE